MVASLLTKCLGFSLITFLPLLLWLLLEVAVSYFLELLAVLNIYSFALKIGNPTSDLK